MPADDQLPGRSRHLRSIAAEELLPVVGDLAAPAIRGEERQLTRASA